MNHQSEIGAVVFATKLRFFFWVRAHLGAPKRHPGASLVSDAPKPSVPRPGQPEGTL